MPVAPTFPGVYIDEVKSQVRTIVGVPTSITAFVGSAAKGDVDEPVHITSWGDFERTFGGLSDDHLMSYMVFQYFQNGGSDGEIVRVAASDAAPAKLDLGNGVQLEAASAGDWGSQLRARVEPVDKTKPTEAPYNLVVRDMATGREETYLNIDATAGSPQALSTMLQGSSLVRTAKDSKDDKVPTASKDREAGKDPFAEDLPKPPDPPPDPPPAPTAQAYVQASGGTDGAAVDNTALKGDPAKKSGIYALDKLGNRLFNLLCIAPVSRDTGFDSYDDAAKYCLDHRAVLLVDAPHGWGNVSQAVAGAASAGVSRGNGRNAAIYFPRLELPDEHGNVREYPPSGAIAGLIARTDGERGVWKAPAGTDASLSSVRDLTVKLTNPEHGQLNPLGVNCVRNFPVIGTVVWGARTMVGADQLADEWKYLPVRRTALYIEESLYRGTQWVVFEPNDEPLWSSIRLNVGAFMNSLWRQGAFQGSSPDQAYLVKCDGENNPQNDIDRGIVNILVGFAPLKPAEFVVIHIQQLAGQIQT